MYIVQVHTSGGEGGHKDREPKTRMDRGRYVYSTGTYVRGRGGP